MLQAPSAASPPHRDVLQTKWGDDMVCKPIHAIAATLVVAALLWTAGPGPAQAQHADLELIEKQVVEFYNAGKYKDAASHAARLVEMARARHGDDHVVYAGAISWQALSLWQQDEYAGVEPMLRRALAIIERAYAPEHIELANALNNLANFLQVLGRFAEAEPLMLRALAMDEKLLGPEHASVGRDCNNLGLMYVEQGRFAEAEPLLVRAFAIADKTLPDNHPSRSIRLRTLAVLYREQARYAEAEPLLKRALSLNETHMGSEHIAVAQSLGALGRLYREMGRYRDAEAHHKRALVIREKTFGASSLGAAASLHNLAMIYRDVGQHADAEQAVTRALEIRERMLGPEHHEVGLSVYVLAGIQESRGRVKDAEPLYRRALAIQQKALPPDHPDLAATQANLGNLYKATGRYDAALPLLEGALATREKVLGGNHPAVAANLIHLSELYRLQGRRQDAEKLLRRARTIHRSGIKELPIFFATDRTMEQRGGDVTFGKEPDADIVTLGVALVSIVNAPATSQRERLATASKRGSDLDENTDLGRLSIAPLDVFSDRPRMVEAAREKLLTARAYRNQALLFVHGYNMSFDDAVRRAGQIAYDLDFDGPTFVFSWPSRQRLFGYLEDHETIDIATEHLREFLQSVVAELKAAKVHLIAHSMGNLVLLRALGATGPASDLSAPIGEIVSAAPDVDPTTFRRFATRIKAGGGNLTVYASAADWALRVSGWFRSKPRVGYVLQGKPVLTPGVDTIDITRAGMSLFAINHDVYASSPIVIGDMRRILAGDRPPHERTNEFKPKSSESGMFWYYEPPIEEPPAPKHK
jgi:esterase/lipase superfamily enzyme/Tfp pilus assembly protein PilF